MIKRTFQIEKNIKKNKLANKCADKEEDNDSDDWYKESNSKYSLQKYLKFDNCYFPGQKFKYICVDKDVNEKK